MAEAGPLYKNRVLLLTQTFFIIDNKEELLIGAHEYDFDILFLTRHNCIIKFNHRDNIIF